MRIITASSFKEHALPPFTKLNQLTISDLNALSVATYMFCFHRNCFPPVFSGYFVFNYTVHDHSTCSASKQHIPFVRTNIMKRQVWAYGPRLWNSIESALTLGAPGFLNTYKPQSGSIDPSTISVHIST